MIQYHRTTAASAEQILRDGFRDGVGTYLTDSEFSGVWVGYLYILIPKGFFPEQDTGAR